MHELVRIKLSESKCTVKQWNINQFNFSSKLKFIYQNVSHFLTLNSNFRGPPKGSQSGPAFAKAGTVSINEHNSTRCSQFSVWGGPDKSLAQPGRKQATATKLEIYSTYSPWSLIHFLARCSNFCKPLKKNSECCPSNQVSAAAMASASEEKWHSFNCFFSQENRW